MINKRYGLYAVKTRSYFIGDGEYDGEFECHPVIVKKIYESNSLEDLALDGSCLSFIVDSADNEIIEHNFGDGYTEIAYDENYLGDCFNAYDIKNHKELKLIFEQGEYKEGDTLDIHFELDDEYGEILWNLKDKIGEPDMTINDFAKDLLESHLFAFQNDLDRNKGRER